VKTDVVIVDEKVRDEEYSCDADPVMVALKSEEESLKGGKNRVDVLIVGKGPGTKNILVMPIHNGSRRRGKRNHRTVLRTSSGS
jgi:hypothetical protein